MSVVLFLLFSCACGYESIFTEAGASVGKVDFMVVIEQDYKFFSLLVTLFQVTICVLIKVSSIPKCDADDSYDVILFVTMAVTTL